MLIVEDDLSSASVARLLQEHLAGMVRHSPAESIHALDRQALCADNITVWTVWENNDLLGCGALQELDARHGEIKSMRTAAAHLRCGVASALLQHIIDVARARAYTRVSLETGSGEAFVAADMLYRKFGFEYCRPFSNYAPDPFSRFMTLEL